MERPIAHPASLANHHKREGWVWTFLAFHDSNIRPHFLEFTDARLALNPRWVIVLFVDDDSVRLVAIAVVTAGAVVEANHPAVFAFVWACTSHWSGFEFEDGPLCTLRIAPENMTIFHRDGNIRPKFS